MLSNAYSKIPFRRVLGVFLGQAAALGLLLTTTFLAEPMIREYAPSSVEHETRAAAPIPAANCKLKKTVSAMLII